MVLVMFISNFHRLLELELELELVILYKSTHNLEYKPRIKTYLWLYILQIGYKLWLAIQYFSKPELGKTVQSQHYSLPLQLKQTHILTVNHSSKWTAMILTIVCWTSCDSQSQIVKYNVWFLNHSSWNYSFSKPKNIYSFMQFAMLLRVFLLLSCYFLPD